MLQPPNDMYSSTWDWIKDQNLNPYQRYFMQIYAKRPFTLPVPVGVGKSVTWDTQRYSPEAYLTILPQGRVVGEHLAIITPNNRLLWDLSYLSGVEPLQHPVFSLGIPRKEHIAGNVGVLACEWTVNYYHWMFDVISRLHLLQKSGIPIEKYVLNSFAALPFQIETLSKMGLSDQMIIQASPSLHLQADKVIVPSREQRMGYPSKWACYFLRDKFLKPKNKKLNDFKKIYISRSKSWNRKVSNEEELMELLSHMGFTRVVLEDYSVEMQARIFSSANLIVSPHGASLTNIVFCKPGTKIVEIFPSYFMEYCYWIISQHMNLNYFYLIHPQDESAESDLDLLAKPVKINLDLLLQCLKTAESI